jgi:hypothetical protein
MSMDKLRAELVEAMQRHIVEVADAQRRIDAAQAHLSVVQAKISTLNDVLGSLDELAEAEPAGLSPANLGIADRPFGTGRAPRRDVQGTIKQAVRDYMEAKGIGPTLNDVVIGAGILLGSAITESATRRALDGLIAKGEMRAYDGRYATGGAIISAGSGGGTTGVTVSAEGEHTSISAPYAA